MKADKKTEAEVKAAINNFLKAYSRRDLEGALALLAPDPDLLFIGTGADEKILGIKRASAQMKRDYEQSDEISVKLGPVSISSAGPVAWMFADSTWRVKAGGQEMNYEWRWTMVLEKRQGKWLIAQSHLSAPAQAQAHGESFPSD